MTLHLDDPAQLDLRRWVRPGDTVSWGQACAEPLTLVEALVAQRGELGGVRCFLGIGVAGTVRPEHADHLTLVSYCGTGPNAALHDAGVLDVLPVHYSALPDLLRSGTLRVDVALLLLPPPVDGRYSLGLAGDLVPDLVAGARTVIAEVSDQVPATRGGLELGEDELDVVLHTTRAPAEQPSAPARPEVAAVAARVAELVPDGATLQVGLGAVPDAVLTSLAGHRHLGLHSGLLPEAALPLLESGVLDGARKSVDPGRAVTGLVVGTARLFAAVAAHPGVRVAATRYTHDPAVLAAQDRFTAVNAALEVDLTGAVGAESVGGRYVGAVGGAADFLRGAARARGGVPIVAVRARGIVPALHGPVSTARADVGIVVTEHGAADLRGRTARERRELLIGLAAPELQSDLDDVALVPVAR